MKNVSIFEHVDYKAWLARWLESQGHGSVSRLAEAIGCQRSYVSQVINSHVHLTPDQAFKLGHAALSGETERRYLGLLVEHARAADRSYKSHLENEMQSLRAKSSRLEKVVGRDKELKAESAELYYSAWYYPATHIATSIEPALTEEGIAQGLRLDLGLVMEVLRNLERYQLVEFNGKHFRFKSGGLHLKPESPQLAHFHLMWRQLSVSNFSESKLKEGVHYTVIQTLSEKDYAEFQTELLQLIKKFETVATPSKAEVMVNLNIDFAKVFKA